MSENLACLPCKLRTTFRERTFKLKSVVKTGDRPTCPSSNNPLVNDFSECLMLQNNPKRNILGEKKHAGI